MKSRQISMDAVLCAMCAVLGAVSLELGNFKISFESLPVMIGALLFGPVDGFLIGGIGTFIYQILRYGFSVTTVLWIAPYAICGLLMGLYARRKGFSLSNGQTALAVSLGCVLIFVLNTGVMYVDSIVYQYYSAVYIFGSLPLRTVICVVKAVAFSVVMPILLKAAKKLV